MVLYFIFAKRPFLNICSIALFCLHSSSIESTYVYQDDNIELSRRISMCKYAASQASSSVSSDTYKKGAV